MPDLIIMPGKMKAALLYGLNDLRVEEVDRPTIGSGDVVVKVKVCGVCPTDIRKYRTANHGVAKFPFNMGHEWVGDVVEVGENTKGYAVGARVAGMSYGGYAEYNKVNKEDFDQFAPHPEILLMPIPDDVSYDAATFYEPLADCFHAVVTQAQVVVGDTVLVIGAGQMGLQLLMVSKSVGAKVIISDVLNDRLKLADQLGADMTVNVREEDLKKRLMAFTNGRLVDAVITSVSQSAVIAQALGVVRKRGRVVIFGGAPEGTVIQIDPNVIHYNEVSLVGSEWVGVGGFLDARMCDVALEMIRSGKIPVERLISHKYPLDRIHEAIETVERMSGTKCLITIP